MEKAAGAATAAPVAGAAGVGLTRWCGISPSLGQNLGQESHVVTKMGQKNRFEFLNTRLFIT